MEIEDRIKFQNSMIKYFKSLPTVTKLSYISEYRMLQRLEESLDSLHFQSILALVEDMFPALRCDKILDKNGDINEDYYYFVNLALEKSVTDHEFLKIIMKE
jgi:hypothetical protein